MLRLNIHDWFIKMVSHPHRILLIPDMHHGIDCKGVCGPILVCVCVCVVIECVSWEWLLSPPTCLKSSKGVNVTLGQLTRAQQTHTTCPPTTTTNTHTHTHIDAPGIICAHTQMYNCACEQMHKHTWDTCMHFQAQIKRLYIFYRLMRLYTLL